MAEVTAFRHNALPYPVYGLPWAVVFPFLDADGDLVTGASTPDAEVSKNGDTFADCTNESTEIATNSGMWYLLLTGAEMTADIVSVIAKSATAGMKTTPIVLYPRKLVTLRAGTVGANAGDGTTIQLDSSAVAIDDYYNGCIIAGVIDSTTEVRVIGDYVGSTKVCTVGGPAFITSPDNNDTFTVYLPEGRQVSEANDVGLLGTAISTPATAGIYDVNTKNINNVAAATPGAAGGVFIAGTNAATTVTTALTTTFTGNLTGSVGSVTGAVGSVTGAVGSVTGNVGGNVTGSVGSVTGLTAATVHSDLDDIQARLPAALTAGGKIKASMDEVLASATPATALSKTMTASPLGTVDTGSFTATATEFETDDITEATADHYLGRIILFTSGAMLGQASDITDYAKVGANGHFTVTALTEAPADNVTFIII